MSTLPFSFMKKFPISPFSAMLSAIFVSSCVALAAPVSIYTVQGATDASPLLRKSVTVEGVITADFQGADQLDGFFIQDPQGDNDPATSDGIFVYVSPRSKWAQTPVKVGDRVRVSGRVDERFKQTQISGLTDLEVLGQAALPAPVDVQLPLGKGANLERFEGMLVCFPQTLGVVNQGDLMRYGTLELAPQRMFVPTNQKPMGEIAAVAKPEETPDKAPEDTVETISLDDGSSKQGPKPIPYLDEMGTRRIGDTVAGLTGILVFDHDSYRVEPTIAPVFDDKNPRPAVPPVVGGDLKVAAANVHNYWTTLKNKDNPNARGATSAAEFERQSTKIVAELQGLDADIVGLMELENNGNGAIDDLVGKLNAAYKGQIYAAVPIPATGLGTDAIRVGLIYKIARVMPQGVPLSDNDAAFDRFPLAQTFVDKGNGGVFTVVVNHFKSKGSVPKTGDVDLGEGAWNLKRTAQAKALLQFVDALKIESKDDDVLVIGDLNAYVQEAPLLALRAGGLTHLNLRLPADERYSFGYAGRFGSLDHALATPSLDAQVTGVGEWHINADEPYFLAPEIQRVSEFQPGPYRASDHDPLLVGLSLKAN